MATILRVYGLRVVIYSNDHEPPHVHVIGAGTETKIALGQNGEYPTVMSSRGLSLVLLATALTEIDRNQALLMQRWRDVHGDG